MVNYNSTDCAIKSIESIYKHTSGMPLPNVFVVDNASTDNPEKMYRLFPRIHLLKNKKNVGFSRAVNHALRFGKSPYVVILNPDTIILDGFFHTVSSYLEKNKYAGIVGPKIYDQDGAVQGSARKFPTLLTSMFGRKSPFTKMFPNNPITSKEFVCFSCNGADDIETDWISGACMIIRRKAIEEIAGFDERFFLYWEDTDICRRIKEAGWKVVYHPKAKIIHSVGVSSSTNPISSICHFHSSCFKLFIKHSKMPLRMLAPIVFCGLILRCVFVMFLNRYKKLVIERNEILSPTLSREKTNNKSRNNNNFLPKVLIVNQYFPPDRSATAGILERIALFLSTAMRVTILAGRPSYQPDEFLAWKPLNLNYHFNINIIRVGSTAFPRRTMAKRILNYCSYLFFAQPVALLIEAQLIIALTDPPLVFLIALIAAKFRKIPFVYFIQDLHPDMAIAAGMIKPNALAKLWEKTHQWGLKSADLVIVIGEDMRKLVLNKGVEAVKTIVIRHGSQPLIENLPDQSHPVVKELKCGFKIAIIHAGNIGYYGAWDTILQAARCLKNDASGFVFVGEGAAKESLQQKVKEKDKVCFLPFRPRSEFDCVLAAGDMHLITIRHGLEGTVVPSKIYPILAAGRPVLALAPAGSDVARIIREYGCGVVVDPDDADALVAVIEDLSKSSHKIVEMGRNSKIAAERMSQNIEMQKLLSAIAKLLPKKNI
jgi:GT2 family glycosyltransferase/glycosyltransferase involved in cell wall biosynthesis